MTGARSIVMFGTGGLASVVRYVLERDSLYRVVALTVDPTHVEAATAVDLEVVPFDDVARRFPPADFGMFVAVGFSRMNAVRAARCEQAREMGYELTSHVSDRASVWPDLHVGPNTIVMEDCTIGPEARVGAGCIVWPRCYIGHGASIGDNCYVAANASISGLAVIGSRSVLGSASVVRDRITVGEACIVGAGAVLTTDLEPYSVVAAPPPRRLPGRSDRLPDL